MADRDRNENQYPVREEKLVQNPEERVEETRPPAADPFQSLYDAIAARSESEVKRRGARKPPLRFRASEAGSCLHRIWFRLMGYEPRPDAPDLVLKQVEGNVAQDLIRGLFSEYGIPIEGISTDASKQQTETMNAKETLSVPMPDGSTELVEVSARADGVVETPRGRALLEFKTMDGYRADWLQKAYEAGGNDAVVARILKKHQYYDAQIQVTMELFGFDLTYLGTKDCSRRSYGMENRDGTRTGIYIEKSPERVRERLTEFALVQRAIRAGERPSPAFLKLDGSAECNWCPFYQHCHGAAKGAK